MQKPQNIKDSTAEITAEVEQAIDLLTREIEEVRAAHGNSREAMFELMRRAELNPALTEALLLSMVQAIFEFNLTPGRRSADALEAALSSLDKLH
jgi:uncharacterized protein YigA (DUF484 family)